VAKTLEDRQRTWDKAVAKMRSATDAQRPQRWEAVKAAFAEYRAATKVKP